ncbi:S8 family serine peptidase [Colwellia sp. D2M02]|uniref:S8 family serine peptidase n=1 Tax=Colwellia sp. D2M02 TaxID=2841562 RepID=UPI001C0A53AB|nr:S8 family serine peptidase [Colwellia sp. D2M02]MBU2892905.1 S8 family serine peptidase [Colwellia sp. D2M02]
MNKNNLKLSLLSTAILLTLAGCGGSDSKTVNKSPIAKSITIENAKQWLPVTGTIKVANADVSSLKITIMDNGQKVTGDNGVYHLSHGILELTGLKFSYISLTGEDKKISYTASANGKSSSASIDITGVTGDPLINQQWHLRNTGQKAYALSDEMKAGLISLYVNNFGWPEEAANERISEIFAIEEAKLIAGEDINVVGAYSQGVTGEGVVAVVVDSGLEIRHEDLEPNVLPNRSLNLNLVAADKTDPTPTAITGDHGTSVAGLIAAKGWNDLGGQGVSPDTNLIGMNYLGTDKVPQKDYLIHGFPGSGISKSEPIAVFNRSYGLGEVSTHFGYSELDEAIESYPSLVLRNAKGALNIKSSGNSFEGGGWDGSLCADNGAHELGLTCYNAAYESSQVHPYYLSVGAVNTDGKHTSYSTAGANLFVAAPAGEYGRNAPAMVTTDQMTCLSGYSGFTGRGITGWAEAYGEDFAKSQFPFNFPGHDDNVSCNYTSTFNGTSSAAPNASGVISLILSANPELTWRDVRHILASTSTKNDPDNAAVTFKVGDTDFVAHQGWIENAAGFNFNNLYGFGRVNAGEAVKMAKAYTQDLGEQVITDWLGAGSTAGEPALMSEIPDNNAEGLTYTVEVSEDLNLEAMQFKFNVSNIEMGFGFEDGTQTTAGTDLAIEVTSPSGTKSMLLSSKQALTVPANADGWQVGYILKDGVFLSNAFYGESSKGQWSIRLIDTSGASYATTDGGILELTGYTNNAVNSVLEGVSLRAFGHEK